MVMIDPPLEAPKDGFKPVTTGACTTAKSTVNITSPSKHESVELTIRGTTVAAVCAGMLHRRAVEVKNVDTEAEGVVPAQQNTPGSGSNPLPMMVTIDDLRTNPKLGDIASYTAPVEIEIAASTLEGE
jgi:hypothetical protein